MAAELALVIPTLNERGNVGELIARLDRVLSGIRWEAIFVDDDSSDGTREVLAEIGDHDPRVRFIHRIDRRGLSSACIEGMLATAAPFVAVMDADLQHDESLLPAMFRILRDGEADIVVGSRYMEGGGFGEWNSQRKLISRFATALGTRLLRVAVTDPMSGFFMLTRPMFDHVVRRLSGKGFKILLDILASAKEPFRCRELPFVFRTRVSGDSKLDSLVAYEFGLLLYEKLFGHILPTRFLMFTSVGLIGALLHLCLLGAALKLFGWSFVAGQTLATLCAMVLNFLLNNTFTHRDRRLKGARLARGLSLFVLVCAIGAVGGVAIADFLFQHKVPWWSAGLLGAVVAAVWNYAVSSTFVWSRR